MMLSSGVAKQHDFTITFAEGVSKAFLLSVVLHSSETFQVPHTTSMKIFPKLKLYPDSNYEQRNQLASCIYSRKSLLIY